MFYDVKYISTWKFPNFLLCRLMRKDGWPAMCIHGDKQQKERDWVLGEFKNGSTSILVATDVAARGLDVDDVKFVINYDYPNNSEDYIHRIGEFEFSEVHMMINLDPIS